MERTHDNCSLADRQLHANAKALAQAWLPAQAPACEPWKRLIFRAEPTESFLLMKHQARWDLPKGHIEAGESELECALREMEEETGIPRDAIQLDPDFRFTHQYVVRDKHLGGQEAWKTLVIFLGRLLRDIPINTTEHPDFAWFDWPPESIQPQTIDPLLAAVAKWRAD